MNRNPLRTTAFLAIVILIASACATTSVERKQQTAEEVGEMRDAALQTRTQIDKTLGSLNALLTAPASELPDVYARYASDVEQLDQHVAKVQEQSQAINAAGSQWLADWRRSYNRIQDPELRAISEEQRDEIAARLDRINRASREANDALLPLIRDLRDVRTVIGNNLTAQNVRNVASADAVRNADYNARIATENLDMAISDFQALSNTLASTD